MYSASMRPERYDGEALRILSWNVASLRAMLTKVGRVTCTFAACHIKGFYKSNAMTA